MDAGTSNLYPTLSGFFLALLFPVLVTPSDSEDPASRLLSIVTYLYLNVQPNFLLPPSLQKWSFHPVWTLGRPVPGHHHSPSQFVSMCFLPCRLGHPVRSYSFSWSSVTSPCSDLCVQKLPISSFQCSLSPPSPESSPLKPEEPSSCL